MSSLVRQNPVYGKQIENYVHRNSGVRRNGSCRCHLEFPVLDDIDGDICLATDGDAL
jgi:hypothetical protein